MWKIILSLERDENNKSNGWFAIEQKWLSTNEVLVCFAHFIVLSCVDEVKSNNCDCKETDHMERMILVLLALCSEVFEDFKKWNIKDVVTIKKQNK